MELSVKVSDKFFKRKVNQLPTIFANFWMDKKLKAKKKDQGITVEKCNNLDFNSGKNYV